MSPSKTQMNNKNYKIIFIGTPDFAVPSLNKLIKSNYNIISAITQPDKKVGRKQEVVFSPVKKVAIKHNIPLLQPKKIKEIYNKIEELKPDIIITCAYGQIIPKNILDIPKFGCINVHGSISPKYRGASPIQYAILNGDQKTGITIMEMNEKMDEGDIISQKEIEIENSDTASSLHDKLSDLGSDLLLETLPKIFNEEAKYTPQDNSKATYTKILKKENGKIDWNKDATKIERMVRAFYPWPGTYTKLRIMNHKLRFKRLKIINIKVLNVENNLEAGSFFKTKDENLAIKCGKNGLILEKVQIEGKKAMSGKEFLRGYKNVLNNILNKCLNKNQ
jgi:methionyl-tRNA formyltransferase